MHRPGRRINDAFTDKKLISEATVKKRIKALLDTYRGRELYYYMPVPGGYGRSTLDYLGFARGRGFAIEAKSPVGVLTQRQQAVIDEIKHADCPVFVIRDNDSLDEFAKWLAEVMGE